MFFGQARIDFPSDELLRKPTLGGRLLRRLKRSVDLGTGFRVLSVGAANLLAGFGEAFSALGIRNVVTLVADDRILYADDGDTEDDLSGVIESATRPGDVGEEFERLCFVTRLRGIEQDFVFELEVRREALRRMLLVDAVVAGRWTADNVFVLASRGSTIFRSDEIPAELPWREVDHCVDLGEERVEIAPAFRGLNLKLGEPQAGRDPHPVYARFHQVGRQTGKGRLRTRSGGPVGGRMGGLLGF